MHRITRYLFIICTLLNAATIYAQTTEALIRRGNRFYNKQDFDQSLSNYEKALKKSPGNPDAIFNLGDAFYRKNDYEKAAGTYDDVLQSKADEGTRQSAYYNKGVAMVRQKKVDEGIDAWKNALRLDPADSNARENLVRALMEKKKQDQQQNKKDNPDKKQNDNKQKKEQNKQDSTPKQQQSKLNKQQVEQYLRSLEQREKDVQDKMNQNKTHTLSHPEKDW